MTGIMEDAQNQAVAETEAKETKSDVKVSAKLEKLISEIETLTVIELSELVKALEDKFGVTAAAPVAVAAGGAAAGASDAPAAEEKDSYEVVLAEAGANKIAVIKAVREINQELGLAEAKALVDAAPKTLLENAKKEAAEEAKKKLEEAGAKVELK